MLSGGAQPGRAPMTSLWTWLRLTQRPPTATRCEQQGRCECKEEEARYQEGCTLRRCAQSNPVNLTG